MTRLLRNARGQTAIFIALIFQVLFVLFAMALNVALVVHDKINLQNAVDLAAYYAAERQAEHLNAIAHVNYQIRQAWKLLAWRYRILGTMGLRVGASEHPVWSGDTSETLYPASTAPATCVTYTPTWVEVPPNENLCNRPNLYIPPLPQVPVIAGFIGINAAVAALSTQLIKAFDSSCELFGAYNWWFSMAILQSYRIEQRNRKLLILAIANNLSASQDDFMDINGASAKTGAYQTFVKNLTYANQTSGPTFEMLNSLGGLTPGAWLNEVKISPTLLYTDAANAAACSTGPRLISLAPQKPGAQAKIMDPNTLNGAPLIPWSQGEPPPTDPYSFSIGVEKNPWYLAYVGIQATTTPRQIFFPFGPNVTLTARAFAQPFGGRIGPWFATQWPQSSSQSVGDQIDNLLPPRPNADGTMDSPNDPRRLPNYSRFPGDVLGLTSHLAQNSLTNMNKVGITFEYFKQIYTDFAANNSNDTLAWDYVTNKIPIYRYYELAAIAPDLFDITYYSIEPDFAVNYLQLLQANANALKIPTSNPIRGDFGTHVPQIPNYSIQDQMNDVQTQQLHIAPAFYYVRSRANLLTGWAFGDGAVDYVKDDGSNFPVTRFGQCQQTDDTYRDKVPGSCPAGGGRTGYSVMLVNRNALNSSSNSVGGSNVPPGAYTNPPAKFQW